jgi:hypothetical protein
VGFVAELQKPNFLKGDPSYPRNCICVVSTNWKLNAEFSNQPLCKLIISPLKYSDYKLLCHLGDVDAECENAEYVCKSMVLSFSWVCHLKQFVLCFTLQGTSHVLCFTLQGTSQYSVCGYYHNLPKPL